MKIVNILGGLGNQMFQYALAVALRERHPEEAVCIDSSGFKGYPCHNGYELKRIFNVKIPEATAKQQRALFYPLRNYRMWQLGTKLLPRRKSVFYEADNMKYDPYVLECPESIYYLGYWQTEQYFKSVRKEILEAFSFPTLTEFDANKKLMESIRGKNTVSVHVRRGDYLNIANTQGICGLKYYVEAISHIKCLTEPAMFIVFSDGIEWCKENLSEAFGSTPVFYVDWNKGVDSFRDMQLMSLCSHNIIANSSFSWWGAWLNRNTDKIVVAPSIWMNNGGWVDIIPDTWHTIHKQ